MPSMSWLKTFVLATWLGLGTIASSAQSTNDALADTLTPCVQKDTRNAMPTFTNPREWSLIHQLQNNGLVEWFYTYKQNNYLQVKFKMEWRNTRIIVKMYYVVDQSDESFWLLVRDRFVLDGFGHYLRRNPYPSDEAMDFEIFLISTPITFVSSEPPVLTQNIAQ